jgi:pimeloyl-ACP methyl ester carboxylesterase
MERKRINIATLIVAVSVCAACAGPRFRSARLLPDHAVPLARLECEPCVTAWVEVDEHDREPVRIACHELCRGYAEWVVFCIHGVLSDSRSWCYVAGDLILNNHLVLIDLKGCGKSSKPDPRDLPLGSSSPDALAREVLLAMRHELRKLPDDTRVALAGHSLGGMVILRALGKPDLRRQFADVIGRVERVILACPVGFAVESPPASFREFLETGDFTVELAESLGILRPLLGVALEESAYEPDHLPREELDRFACCVGTPETRRAAKQMLREAVPYKMNGRPDWVAIRALEGDYRNADHPVLILWGAQDERFSSGKGYRLRSRLPNAWLHVLERCMHTIPSERNRCVAKEIQWFVETGGHDSPRELDEYFGDRLPSFLAEKPAAQAVPVSVPVNP